MRSVCYGLARDALREEQDDWELCYCDDDPRRVRRRPLASHSEGCCGSHKPSVSYSVRTTTTGRSPWKVRRKALERVVKARRSSSLPTV